MLAGKKYIHTPQRMLVWIFPLLLILIAGCFSRSLLKEPDYIKMTDLEIKKTFLKYTPIGSKEKDVRHIVRKNFNLSLKKYFTYDNENIVASLEKTEPGKIQLGDYELEATAASYGWAKHFFLAGNYVSISWIFNKNGILKDIAVCHCWSGV